MARIRAFPVAVVIALSILMLGTTAASGFTTTTSNVHLWAADWNKSVVDTSSEAVTFYDLDRLPASHRQEFEAARALLEQAGDRDAHERCRRFLSAPLTLSFAAAGYAPALLILAAFIPFVWGIGSIASASVLTFRRGTGVIGFGTFALTFTSGAYFPIGLFPHWVESLARLNPIAVAITGMREQLLGGSGWADAAVVLAKLLPMSAVSLLLGLYAFRLAMRRERRLGTLGLY